MENRIQRRRFQRSHQNQNTSSRVQLAQMYHSNSQNSLGGAHSFDENIGRRVSELESFFIQERNERQKLQEKIEVVLSFLAEKNLNGKKNKKNESEIEIEKGKENQIGVRTNKSTNLIEINERICEIGWQCSRNSKYMANMKQNNQENPEKNIPLLGRDQYLPRQMENLIEHKIKQFLDQHLQSKFDLLDSVPVLRHKLEELSSDLNSKIQSLSNLISKQQFHIYQLAGGVDRFRLQVFRQFQSLFQHIERRQSQLNLHNQKSILKSMGELQEIFSKWKQFTINKTQMVCQVLEKQSKDIENLSIHYPMQQNININSLVQAFEYAKAKMAVQREIWQNQMKNSIKDIQLLKNRDSYDRDYEIKERVRDEVTAKSQEMRGFLSKEIKQKCQRMVSAIQLLIERHIQKVEDYLKGNQEKEDKILNSYLSRYN